MVIIGCKRDKDDPSNPIDINEQEVITSVTLNFVNTSNKKSFLTKWRDSDGSGGAAPVIDSIFLDTNTVYNVSIEFLDESGSTVKDITAEIKSESSAHLVCFEPTSNHVSVKRTDSDGTYEIGLSSSWKTTTKDDGKITISLKHQLDVKDGTCTPGETDVEVVFPLIVE